MQFLPGNRTRVVMAATSVMLALNASGSTSSNFEKATAAIVDCSAGFNMMVPPNANARWAIIGILPSPSGRETPQSDAGLAKFAVSQVSRNGKWQRASVFIIRNQQAADLFLTLQNKNQNKSIDLSNFRDMTTVWNNTSVYYDVRGKKARVFYPQKSRLPWWKILQ